MSQGDLTANERGTVQMFGKPYHWKRDEDGVLRLHAGVSPDETTMTMSEAASLAKKGSTDV